MIVSSIPKDESCRPPDGGERQVRHGDIKRETGLFASASETLLSLISNTALPEEDRSLVDYYIREIEQGLDHSFPQERSS